MLQFTTNVFPNELRRVVVVISRTLGNEEERLDELFDQVFIEKFLELSFVKYSFMLQR